MAQGTCSIWLFKVASLAFDYPFVSLTTISPGCNGVCVREAVEFVMLAYNYNNRSVTNLLLNKLIHVLEVFLTSSDHSSFLHSFSILPFTLYPPIHSLSPHSLSIPPFTLYHPIHSLSPHSLYIPHSLSISTFTFYPPIHSLSPHSLYILPFTLYLHIHFISPHSLTIPQFTYHPSIHLSFLHSLSIPPFTYHSSIHSPSLHSIFIPPFALSSLYPPYFSIFTFHSPLTFHLFTPLSIHYSPFLFIFNSLMH